MKLHQPRAHGGLANAEIHSLKQSRPNFAQHWLTLESMLQEQEPEPGRDLLANLLGLDSEDIIDRIIQENGDDDDDMACTMFFCTMCFFAGCFWDYRVSVLICIWSLYLLPRSILCFMYFCAILLLIRKFQ